MNVKSEEKKKKKQRQAVIEIKLCLFSAAAARPLLRLNQL